MPSRSQRAQTARQTVEILQRGWYTANDGTRVRIADSLKQAREGTCLYSPDALDDVVWDLAPTGTNQPTRIEVRNTTTFAAARQLAELDPACDPLCLNFASAKNAGGGFLNGSQAQEESLARASGLYACIGPVRAYYDANRQCGTCLYTHHMIYSPRVPVFRDDHDQLLKQPFCTSIMTAPAVNAGAVLRQEPNSRDRIVRTMLERIERVLAVAVRQQHHTLVLGAWGCGVFRNEPQQVAGWFRSMLTDQRFRNRFRHIVFAVLDSSRTQQRLSAFERAFGATAEGQL